MHGVYPAFVRPDPLSNENKELLGLMLVLFKSDIELLLPKWEEARSREECFRKQLERLRIRAAAILIAGGMAPDEASNVVAGWGGPTPDF